MADRDVCVVTGGLSYIGKHITKRLVERGSRVIVMTGHPDRPNPFGNKIQIVPYQFDSEERLTQSLQGATTLYNTYWVRFDYGDISFAKAVENTGRLLRAAEKAGIKKLVHLSVSNPSKDASFPYFRGKARIEEMIRQSKLSYAIIRPTLVFGGEEEILVNNIAWLLRWFPIFAIPTPRNHRLQPIHVDEVADLAVKAATDVHNKVLDAAGPDIMTFEAMVKLLHEKVGSYSLLVPTPSSVVMVLLAIVGVLVRDVVLTRDELGALMAELLVSKEPPIGRLRMSDWLQKKETRVGCRYASEMIRHF